MKIAVSSDEYTHLVDVVLRELEKRGHEALYFGPREGDDSADWPAVTMNAIDQIRLGNAKEAIVMCWTGTGCSIAANKVNGVRAALCSDAETARGARIWNHANVLALSLRNTPDAVVKEILDKWFETPFSTDDWNLKQMESIRNIEDKQK